MVRPAHAQSRGSEHSKQVLDSLKPDLGVHADRVLRVRQPVDELTYFLDGPAPLGCPRHDI